MQPAIDITSTLLYNPFQGDLCMKGTIRTLQKCPKCGGKFTEGVIDQFKNLWCMKCLTNPQRYYVFIYSKHRYKIYSDQQGKVLESYIRAERLLNKIRTEIDARTFDPRDYVASTIKPLRFSVNITEWLKWQKERLESGDIAPSYYEKIESTVHHYFIPYFEGIDIREIRTAHVQDFLRRLPKGLKPKTRKNIMAMLQKYFNDLFLREEIARLPKFPQINVPDPHWNWVDVDEQEIIFDKIPEKYRPIFAFMKEHGCRPGEARAIWRKDIINLKGECLATIRRSFSNDVYREQTKTKRARVIPIQEDIAKMIKHMPIVDGFLFIDPDTGEAYKKRKLERLFNRAKKGAGIEDITLYQWTRHSFCSQAVNRGVPLKVIREMVGHTSESAARRYEHLQIDKMKQALKPKPKTKVKKMFRGCSVKDNNDV